MRLASFFAGGAAVYFSLLKEQPSPAMIIIIGLAFTFGGAFLMLTHGQTTASGVRSGLAVLTGVLATSTASIKVLAANEGLSGGPNDYMVAHAWLHFATFLAGTVLFTFLAFYVYKNLKVDGDVPKKVGLITGAICIGAGLSWFTGENFVTAINIHTEPSTPDIASYQLASAIMIALGVMICAIWFWNYPEQSATMKTALGAVIVATGFCITGVGMDTFNTSPDLAHQFTMWGGASAGFVIGLMFMLGAISYCRARNAANIKLGKYIAQADINKAKL